MSASRHTLAFYMIVVLALYCSTKLLAAPVDTVRGSFIWNTTPSNLTTQGTIIANSTATSTMWYDLSTGESDTIEGLADAMLCLGGSAFMTCRNDSVIVTDRLSGARIRAAKVPFPPLPDDLDGHFWYVVAKGGRYALFTWIARKVTWYTKSGRYTDDIERTYVVDLALMSFRILWQIGFGNRENADYTRHLRRMDITDHVFYSQSQDTITIIDLATAKTKRFAAHSAFTADLRYYAGEQGVRDFDTYRLITPLTYDHNTIRFFTLDGNYLLWLQYYAGVINQHRLINDSIERVYDVKITGSLIGTFLTDDGRHLIATGTSGVVMYDLPPVDTTLRVRFEHYRHFYHQVLTYYSINDIPRITNTSVGNTEGVTFRWHYHDDSVSYSNFGDRVYPDSGTFPVRLIASRHGVDIGSYTDTLRVYSTKWAQIHYRDTGITGTTTWTRDGSHIVVANSTGSYRVLNFDSMRTIDTHASPGLCGIALPLDDEHVAQWYLSSDTIHLVWIIRDLQGRILQRDSMPVLPSLSQIAGKRDLKTWQIRGAVCDSGRSVFIGMRTDRELYPGFLMEFRSVPGGIWPWAAVDTAYNGSSLRRASVEDIATRWHSPIAYVSTARRTYPNGEVLPDQIYAHEAGTGLSQYSVFDMTIVNTYFTDLMSDLCTIGTPWGLINFWDAIQTYPDPVDRSHRNVTKAPFNHSWRIASVLEDSTFVSLRIFTPDSSARQRDVAMPVVLQNGKKLISKSSKGLDVSPDDRFVAVSTSTNDFIVFDLRVIPETDRTRPTFFLPKATRTGSPERSRSRLFESNGRLRFRAITSPDTGVQEVTWYFGTDTAAYKGTDVYYGFPPGEHDVYMRVKYSDGTTLDTLRKKYITHGSSIVSVTDTDVAVGAPLSVNPHPVPHAVPFHIGVSDHRIVRLEIYSIAGERHVVLPVTGQNVQCSQFLTPGLYVIRGINASGALLSSSTFIVQ